MSLRTGLLGGSGAGVDPREAKKWTVSVSVHVTPFVALKAAHVSNLQRSYNRITSPSSGNQLQIQANVIQAGTSPR